MVRLLLSNRVWVLANRSLFVRTRSGVGAGVRREDWVYRRVTANPGVTRPRIMAIVVDLGRLGNALSRISKAVVIARENDWRGVILPRHSHFSAYAPLVGPESLEVEGFLATSGDGRWGSSGPPEFIVRREFHYESIEPTPETGTLVKRVLSGLFSRLELKDTLTTEDLVIHVRSGDIYYRERVGNWGQPPFAYYEKIIREGSWVRVFVVCEDDQSPVLGPIANLCKHIGIEHFFQSGTLGEDLALLASAKNLAVGRGTFAPAVVLLNPVLKKLFFFEDRFVSKFLDSATEVVRVIDEVGTYRESVLHGRWINSPGQRELMVDYPVSALRFESISV